MSEKLSSEKITNAVFCVFTSHRRDPNDKPSMIMLPSFKCPMGVNAYKFGLKELSASCLFCQLNHFGNFYLLQVFLLFFQVHQSKKVFFFPSWLNYNTISYFPQFSMLY